MNSRRREPTGRGRGDPPSAFRTVLPIAIGGVVGLIALLVAWPWLGWPGRIAGLLGGWAILDLLIDRALRFRSGLVAASGGRSAGGNERGGRRSSSIRGGVSARGAGSDTTVDCSEGISGGLEISDRSDPILFAPDPALHPPPGGKPTRLVEDLDPTVPPPWRLRSPDEDRAASQREVLARAGVRELLRGTNVLTSVELVHHLLEEEIAVGSRGAENRRDLFLRWFHGRIDREEARLPTHDGDSWRKLLATLPALLAREVRNWPSGGESSLLDRVYEALGELRDPRITVTVPRVGVDGAGPAAGPIQSSAFSVAARILDGWRRLEVQRAPVPDIGMSFRLRGNRVVVDVEVKGWGPTASFRILED